MRDFIVEEHTKTSSKSYILVRNNQNFEFDKQYYLDGKGDSFLNIQLRHSLKSATEILFSTLSDEALQKMLPNRSSCLFANSVYVLELNKSKEDILQLLSDGKLILSDCFTGQVINGYELSVSQEYKKNNERRILQKKI